MEIEGALKRDSPSFYSTVEYLMSSYNGFSHFEVVNNANLYKSKMDTNYTKNGY